MPGFYFITHTPCFATNLTWSNFFKFLNWGYIQLIQQGSNFFIYITSNSLNWGAAYASTESKYYFKRDI